MHKDVELAWMYVKKAQSTKDRGLDFELSLSEYVSLSKDKYCFYTGVLLTSKNRTIERLNPNIGYYHSNCVAVSSKANSAKSALDAFLKSDVFTSKQKASILGRALSQVNRSK